MNFNISFISDLLPQKEGVYIVGGTVRDILLGQRPMDFDIAVEEQPEKLAEKIASGLSSRPIAIGKPGKQILRIVSGDLTFDISQVAGASIEEDLKQRDFTINAMAYSLSRDYVIDPSGGQEDLFKGVVRMVSDGAFKRDPIRLLRAFRISAAYGFVIETDTLQAINANASLIMKSAGERIRDELFKLMGSSESYPYILLMKKAGILFEIFPALRDLVGCLQNRHHRFDVFNHTVSAYHHLERLFGNLSSIFPEPELTAIFQKDKKRQALLKYAVILHDIGKPTVKSQDAGGNIHFYGHGEKSAIIAAAIGRTLRLSVKESTYINDIIYHHDRPRHLFTLHQKQQLSEKARVKFFLKCGNRTPDILLHSLADHLGKGLGKSDGFVEFAKQMIRTYLSGYSPKKLEKPLITGQDLIHIFKLTPSPLFKKIINYIEESRLADEIKTRQEAILWVKSFLDDRSDSNT